MTFLLKKFIRTVVVRRTDGRRPPQEFFLSWNTDHNRRPSEKPIFWIHHYLRMRKKLGSDQVTKFWSYKILWIKKIHNYLLSFVEKMVMVMVK
jgi:hypothetical protein